MSEENKGEEEDFINPLKKVEIWEKTEKRLTKNMEEKDLQQLSTRCRRLVLLFIESLEEVKVWDGSKADEIKEELSMHMYDLPPTVKDEANDENKETNEGNVEEKHLSECQQFSLDYAIVFRIPSMKDLGIMKQALEDNKHNDEYFEAWTENELGQEMQHCTKVHDYLNYSGVVSRKYKVMLGSDKEEVIPDEEKKQNLYILFGATETRLRKEAARIEYDLLLDVDQIKIQGREAKFPLYVNLCEKKEDDTKSNDPFANLGKLFHIEQKVEDYKELFKNIYGHFADFLLPGRPENEHVRDKLYRRYNKKELNFEKSGCRDKSVFTELARLKLTKSIIEAELNFGGGDLMVAAYARDNKHPCIGFFPLHNENRRQALQVKIAECCPVLRDVCCCTAGGVSPNFIQSDIHWELRDYFGEQVGMYFQYLSHYTLFLIPAAIAGFLVALVQVATMQIDVPVLPFFGVFMIIWASLYLESWKRMESELRTIWGTFSFKEKETARPEFEGQLVFSKTTGKLEATVPVWKSMMRIVFSQSIVWTFIAAVVAVVFGLLLFKQSIYVTQGASSPFAMMVPPLVNAATIMIMNIIFSKFSKKLNHFENHKTDSSFENSLISKTFLFKFVNSYYSLFTIAFAKRLMRGLGYCKNSYIVKVSTIKNEHAEWHHLFVDETANGTIRAPLIADMESYPHHWSTSCANWHKIDALNISGAVHSDVCDVFEMIQDPNMTWDYRGDCMFELMIQLGTVFITPLFVGNAIEILTPLIKRQKTLKKNAIDEADHVSVAQHEFSFEQYHGTFADYDELIVQFGFVVLFVVAFPFVPVLALLSCVVEFRIDGIKLTEFTRRPYPKAVYNIGTWSTMLKIIGFIAILTNSALLIMTPSSSFPNFKNGEVYLNKQTRLFAFIAVEHSLVAVKFLVDYFLPDEPRWVGDHLERQEEVTNVLILGETAVDAAKRESLLTERRMTELADQSQQMTTTTTTETKTEAIPETTETTETTETDDINVHT